MPEIGSSTFSTFGDFLKYLRRRAQLTQRELALAVGYTEGHVSRLEKNLRPPDLATVAALFVPALGLEEEPDIAEQLIRLAANAHGDQLPILEDITISRVQETTHISEDRESIPSNLPIQLTSFIGRQATIMEISAIFSRQEPARLVTLTGPGGIGKTRLALQSAIQLSHHYPDGVWFIDLTALSTPEQIPQTIATILGIAEIHAQAIEETLIAFLRSKRTLMILDNCEHLIQPAAQIAEKLLQACAALQILATSREILHVPGEVNFRVAPLSLLEEPESTSQTLNRQEAVQLFVERARNIQPSFEFSDSNAGAIARICRQLDGMPLAIELAAARLSLLSLSQIEARLKDRFQLLSGGQATQPRHQTLRATLEWSHGLLSEPEKVLFRRLAVFAGGWTLESAEVVCAYQAHSVLDLLAGLANKSLVVVEQRPDGEVRYKMLETIREYAAEQFHISGEMEELRARHFNYFLQVAQEGEPDLFSRESPIDWAEAEIDNLRAALTWSLEGRPSQKHAGNGLKLISHVWLLWWSRGLAREGAEWLRRLLAIHTAETTIRARALLLSADMAGFRGDLSHKIAYIQEALSISQKLRDPKCTADALMQMGLIERDLRHYEEANIFLLESLSKREEMQDELWICRVSFLLAESHLAQSNLDEAQSFLQRGMHLCQTNGDRWQLAWGLEILGNLALQNGDLAQAEQHYKASLKLRRELTDKPGIIYAVEALARWAAEKGKFQQAATLWGSIEALRESMNLLVDPLREDMRSTPMTRVQRELSEAGFKQFHAMGQKLDMQQVIEFALNIS